MNPVRNIVVIGAALGGVTAIAKLALKWPAELPVAVLVALATPDQPARMVLQIIRSYAPIAVKFAERGEEIQARRIYLSPLGHHMTVQRGGLVHLDPGDLFDVATPSVDRLFSSAASVYGSRVIGVVLSGNSKDGAQGLRDIEASGGVGIVQAPDDAVEPKMPRNAIANDDPAYCVRAGDIGTLVQRLVAGHAI